MRPSVLSRGRAALRAALVLSAAGGLTAAAATSAQAASAVRTEQFDVPSLQGNVDVKRAVLNETTKLTAWVRYPKGYDDDPTRRWPVVYLLHGWEDNAGAWLDPKKGSINSVLPDDFDGLVVMPEGGKNWWMNWGSPAGNPGNEWGDYLYEEVVPFMEEKLRILPGRGNHAIGGLSMGGFGGLTAVSAFPSYFGHGLSFSGLLDNQDFAFTQIIGVAQFGKPGYASMFGNQFGAYATSVNPLKNAREFAGSRLTIHYGTPNAGVLVSLDPRVRGEATLEVGAQGQARQFVDAVKPFRPDLFVRHRTNASHAWTWWRMDVREAAQRGLFRPAPVAQTSDAKNWIYGTMNQHGNAWGLGYQFTALPTQQATFTRAGQVLVAAGRGTVRIAGGAADTDASGNGTRADCTFTRTLPFTIVLPSGC